MSFFSEFKQFAVRGNVVDMAVGVIIGTSFAKVVTSLINDILMPPLGILIGGIDFSHFKISLGKLISGQEQAAIRYGAFIGSIFNFIIIILVIFLLVKIINAVKKEEDKPVEFKNCPECCLSIPINAKRCGHCTSNLA